jgi:hypothetical protein
MRDLPVDVHTELDENLRSRCSGFALNNFNQHSDIILFLVIKGCTKKYEDVWPIDSNLTSLEACTRILASREDIRNLLHSAHTSGKYAAVRQRRKWHMMSILVFTHSLPAELHAKRPEEMFSYFVAGQRYAGSFFL